MDVKFTRDLPRWMRRDLVLEGDVWQRIVGILRAKNTVDEELLGRIAEPIEPISLSPDQALRIGDQIHDTFLERMKEPPAPPPTAPKYLVPIAASNGVWIDPVLGPLQAWRDRQESVTLQLLHLSSFCRFCPDGFTVGPRS